MGLFKAGLEYCKLRPSDPAHLLFSLLLLKSLIISERNALRTSMLSGHCGEFRSRVAITLSISVTQLVN